MISELACQQAFTGDVCVAARHVDFVLVQDYMKCVEWCHPASIDLVRRQTHAKLVEDLGVELLLVFPVGQCLVKAGFILWTAQL